MQTRMIPVFLRDLLRIRARERWPRERIVQFQQRRLASLRTDAVARSPFYRELHRGLEDAPFEALPTVGKVTMMSRFDDVVTDRRIRFDDLRRHMRDSPDPRPYLGRYTPVTSSGSTGEVAIILTDPFEHVYGLAAASRARAFAGVPWNPFRPRRVAEVVSTLHWSASGQSARTERSRFAPVLHLNAADPVEQIVPPLNAWQPELLEGYTTTLGILAREQIEGRLQIHPRYVGSGGETMTPEVLRLIRDAWDQAPFDYYGAVEAGTIAVECREGRRMHLLDDLLVLEVVDEQNRPVPPGEWGAKILVTPLFRRTQPLIRFEVHDAVRMSPEPCPCGRPFPVFDGIRGKTGRMLRLPRADGAGEVTISGQAFHPIGDLPVVWRRLFQEGDRIVLRVAGVPPGLDVGAAARAVEQVLLEHGVRPTPVEVEILPEVPKTSAGKAPAP